LARSNSAPPSRRGASDPRFTPARTARKAILSRFGRSVTPGLQIDRSCARGAVEAVVSKHGAIDILVNNAGIITVGPVEHVTRADYEEAMAVHFWGPLYTIEAAVPHMRRQGGGRIANISSFGGKLGVPHLVPYCASKFALAGLSGALTPELARDNIALRMNGQDITECSGATRTPTSRVMPARVNDTRSEEARDYMLSPLRAARAAI
jgi:NAD(P)-dependent dehydrogenase (short-subunit alcohol dehydrogenase family)